MVKVTNCDICGKEAYAFVSFLPDKGWSGHYDLCKKHYCQFQEWFKKCQKDEQGDKA